jgi:hypothetical protein
MYFPFFIWELMSYVHLMPKEYLLNNSKVRVGSTVPIDIFLGLVAIFLLFAIFKSFGKNFSWRSWVRWMAAPTVLYIGAICFVFWPAWINLSLNLSIVRNDPVKYERLLKFGADPNKVFNYQGKNEQLYTPLMIAVMSKNVDFVKRLLKDGADPVLKDAEGKTALDIAKERNIKEAVEVLDKVER